jgi:hypothetical protein
LLRRSTGATNLTTFLACHGRFVTMKSMHWSARWRATRPWRPHDVSDPMTSPDSESPRKKPWGDERVVPPAGPTGGLSAAPTQDST